MIDQILIDQSGKDLLHDCCVNGWDVYVFGRPYQKTLARKSEFSCLQACMEYGGRSRNLSSRTVQRLLDDGFLSLEASAGMAVSGSRRCTPTDKAMALFDSLAA